MDLNEYQKLAKENSKVQLENHPISFAILGLGIGGEAGEVQDLMKKFFRDLFGISTPEWHAKMKEELGDLMWYIALIAEQCGYPLESVAESNIEKLKKINEEKDKNES